MEALSSSGTSVLTGRTWRHIPEDGILHSHRRENSQFPTCQNVSDLDLFPSSGKMETPTVLGPSLLQAPH
jgi:hypothetical protein